MVGRVGAPGAVRPVALAAVLAAVLAVLLGITAGPAVAIAHGSRVAHPERTVPWVVAIYQGPAGADAWPEDLVCSGTALDARTVLTAAHCAEQLGEDALSVGFGAATLAHQQRVAVSAIDMHPDYDPWMVSDDVAVLRTAQPMAIAAFPKLPTARQATRARAASTRFTIYGWGDVDRTGVLTGHLNGARLTTRTHRAREIWGSDFNARRQLAAGALRPRARAYPGACAGDSGGPLVMTSRGAPVVVGITSYGQDRCGARSPTIFTAVGHYREWVLATARAQAAAESAGTPAVQAEPEAVTRIPADPDLVAGLP